MTEAMNTEMNENSYQMADSCVNNVNSSGVDVSLKENEAYANDADANDAERAESSNAAANAAEADDTSSSVSEEVMSGAQSDQTANVSSNGGYSGDYESISDSSSGASKKRKVALGIIGSRHRRDAEEEKEEKSDDVMEDDSQDLTSSAPEEDSNMLSVEYDHRRHHHHHHHAEAEKHQVGSSNSIPHHHHYHHKDRPNEARGQQVNRQISEIMNLYNVSLQAQESAQAELDAAAAAKDDIDDTLNAKRGAKAHYQVESNGSISHNELPVQLGGCRVMDPSDPRMDLVKLYQASQSAAAGLGPRPSQNNGPAANSNNSVTNQPQDASNGNLGDCYANLMEACRPFFQDSKTIMGSRKIPMLPTTTANQLQAGSDEAQSSSGFTSFFTTTKSESNTNAGEGSSSQSEFSRKKKKSDDGQQESKSSPSHDEEKVVESPRGKDHDASRHRHGEAYQSDSSSMVVLARMKRKHKDQRRHEGKSKNDEEHVSKRVRIETVALDAAKHRSAKQQQQSAGKQPESSSLSSGLSTSVNSSESEPGGGGGGGGAQTKQHEGAANSTSVEDRSKTDSQSGSAENSKNQTLRTVTDTSGTTTANNSSGSGTGSGNDADPTAKSESGSQIEGTSNSDDKTHIYCEKDSLSDTNTVAAVNGDADKKIEAQQSQPDKPLIHHHNHGGKKIPVVDHTPQDPLESIMEEPEQPNANNAAITKEEKLIEKKRKRMSARKEYEEDLQRQMRDSSESSSKPKDMDVLEPGKPVTLEDVLSFSKTARLLVQALPPFLAVHTNAAFTLLTGIDSHTIIGQPVASIIAIAQSTPPNKESDSSGSDITNNKDALSSLSGSVEGNEGQNDAVPSNGNDANQQGQDQPVDNGNMEMNVQNAPVPPGFRIDRLIVARGYGHIHNVEVKAAEPHTPVHAIEGSEVKFDEAKSGAKRKKKDDKIFCRMSVSPVVMNTESWDRKCEGHTDSKDHKSANKRRKHEHTPVVKHYLIQLESMDGPSCLLAKRSSYSSSTDTTVEAQLLGITRSELVARRCRMEVNRADTAPEIQAPSENRSVPEMNFPETDSQDENASAVEPVATCG